MIYFKCKGILTVLIVCAYIHEHASAMAGNVLDYDLYEEVIDLKQCDKQLAYIQNNTSLRNRFMDASFRIPRSIFKGNFRDTGNYFLCLDISYQAEDMIIDGKYSVVQIPLQQDIFELPTIPDWPDIDWPELPWPEFPWPEWNPNSTDYDEELISKIEIYERARLSARNLLGDGSSPRETEVSPLSGIQMELAFCIPKVCTARHAFDVLTMNFTANLTLNEAFVRLPNDKPWVAADYIAVIVFSTIGLVTLLCSIYDIRHTVLHKRDPKKANKFFTSFSVYTNTKNFFVFTTNPGVITCLDGIRTFAMMWVIVGHTFVTQLPFIPENPLDLVDYIRSFESFWISSAPITVDTFFMISGLLVVYTTASKASRMTLLKRIHLFYMNRILRMLPVLAAMVLIHASFLHRTADGPYWEEMVKTTNDCRINWWSTFLYVSNWVNPENLCLFHTWYLAIDMQLHILSPLVLFWILGQTPRSAWTAMILALIASMAGAATYNFINNFQSAIVSLAPGGDPENYMYYYYFSTVNRISPFVIGMMVGYVLHLCRGKIVKIPWVVAGICWIVAAGTTSAIMVTSYYNVQPDWDNQLADNIINSTIRPAWAASIAWMIFACHQGYGAPINWVLSLHICKIFGRLSYAMYIVHYPLIFLINATTLQPIYFAVNFTMYRFLTDFSLAAIGGFLLTVLIDFPFSNLVKMFIEGGRGPPPKKVENLQKEPEFTAISVVESIRNNNTEKSRM